MTIPPQKKYKTSLLQLIGQRVHHYRQANGNMTQEALADAVNSNATYISKIETGKAQGLSIVMLETIARALNVSLVDLMISNASESADSDIDSMLQPLAMRMKNLTVHQRRIVLTISQQLAEELKKPLRR